MYFKLFVCHLTVSTFGDFRHSGCEKTCLISVVVRSLSQSRNLRLQSGYTEESKWRGENTAFLLVNVEMNGRANLNCSPSVSISLHLYVLQSWMVLNTFHFHQKAAGITAVNSCLNWLCDNQSIIHPFSIRGLLLNMCCFQLLKCDHVLLFFFIYENELFLHVDDQRWHFGL